jgi:hypothetical protein
MTLIEKVIELYEQVACGIITPNQARLGFLKILNKEKDKWYKIGLKDGRRDGK